MAIISGAWPRVRTSEWQRRKARRAATAMGHDLVRFVRTGDTWYSHCQNRGCGLSVIVDPTGSYGNILTVECHAVTFGR